MELVFKKVKRKPHTYLEDMIDLAHETSTRGAIDIITPNGLNLRLEKGVFIPDVGTFEMLTVAEQIINSNKEIKTIADIGTGSGVLAISLAKAFPDKNILAYEVDPQAIVLTERNSNHNGVSNINVVKNEAGEWMGNTPADKVDFVIANPPYVGDESFNSPAFQHDYPDYIYQPESAMRSYDAGGTAPYLEILKAAQERGAKNILFRVDQNNIDALNSLMLKLTSAETAKIAAQNGKLEFLYIKLT